MRVFLPDLATAGVRPQRLSRSNDFRRVYSEGRRSRRNGLTVAAFHRGDGGPPRAGYSIRSSEGGAVTRNRIRRRLRAAITECNPGPGVDLILGADRRVEALNYQVLVEKLGSALIELGVEVSDGR